MSVFTVNSGRVLVLGTVAAFAVMAGLSLGQAPAPAAPLPTQENIEPQLAPPPVPSPTPVPTPEAVAAPAATPAPPSLPTPLRRAADVAFPTPSAIAGSGPEVLIGRPVEQPDYGEHGNRSAARLRGAAPQSFDFDRAALRDVLRLLATEAGIPWIGIDEQSPMAQKLVTFKMTTSPFAALQSVARQNGIKLSYQDGVWFMVNDDDLSLTMAKRMARRAEAVIDQNELIGVIYQLRYDPGQRVDFVGGSGGGSMTQQGAGSGNSITTPNIPLQNSQMVFAPGVPTIVNEIRTMLGLGPIGVDEVGNIQVPVSNAGKVIADPTITSLEGNEANSGGTGR